MSQTEATEARERSKLTGAAGTRPAKPQLALLSQSMGPVCGTRTFTRPAHRRLPCVLCTVVQLKATKGPPLTQPHEGEALAPLAPPRSTAPAS